MSYYYLTKNNTSVRNNDLQTKINFVFDLACTAIRNGKANYIHTPKGDSSIGLCEGITAFSKIKYDIDGWTRSFELCEDVCIYDPNGDFEAQLRSIINCLFDAGHTLDANPGALQTVRSELYGASVSLGNLCAKAREYVHLHAADWQGKLVGAFHLGLLTAEKYYAGQSSEYGLRFYQNVKRDMHVTDESAINAAWGAWLNACYALTLVLDAITVTCDTSDFGEWFYTGGECESSGKIKNLLNSFNVFEKSKDDAEDSYILFNCYIEFFIRNVYPDSAHSEFVRLYLENI